MEKYEIIPGNDHEILLDIQALLDGKDWSPDTLDSIADLLNRNGYQIRDSEIETARAGTMASKRVNYRVLDGPIDTVLNKPRKRI